MQTMLDIEQEEMESEDEWFESNEEMDGDILFSNEETTSKHGRGDQTKMKVTENQKALMKWTVYFLIVWQQISNISDRVMDKLLSFLQLLFAALGTVVPSLIAFSQIFPGSLYRLRKSINLNRDCFERFVVCPECLTLYTEDKLFDSDGNPKKCINEINVSGRKERCNTSILKRVTLSGNRFKYRALKTFCYNGIIPSLERMIQKTPNFLQETMMWRERSVPENVFADVYDGRIWKRLFTGDGELSIGRDGNDYCFGFILNVDWFQPYERRPNFSVGALYLACLNLPKEKRYKKENVIVLGILPAFNKEPASLNTFLKPIVDELKVLWKGIRINTESELGEIKIKAALICCSSDLPANRKLCGFLSHAAIMGCHKCSKEFEYKDSGKFNKHGVAIKRPDYSGFDKNSKNWPARDLKKHKRIAKHISSTIINSEKKKLEKKFGVRWVPLLELDYFDPISFCAIDPMHNIFLGTAKRMFALWVENEILDNVAMDTISMRISSISTLSGVGRLPNKISSCWGKFTAEEWMIWTLYYSLLVLPGILPDEHLRIWHTFVIVCRTVCEPILTTSSIKIIENAFLKFGREYEKKYGRMSTYPNLHLHGHLNECLLDFGPVHGFWCFAFERYNGKIADTHTNHQSIEIQLMRSVTSLYFASTLKFSTPELFSTHFQSECTKLLQSSKISEMSSCSQSLNMFASLHTEPNMLRLTIKDRSNVRTNGTGKLEVLQSTQCEDLLQMYQAIYPTVRLDIQNMIRSYKKFGSVYIGQELFGSRINKRSENNSLIMASWAGENREICFENLLELRPGRVSYFMEHTFEIGGERVSHILAVVRWYKKAELDQSPFNITPLRSWFNRSIGHSAASFIPVQRIHSKFIHKFIDDAADHIGERKFVACPVLRKL